MLPGYELDRWVASAARLWFFLDYDGTLADFAPLPGPSEMEPELVGIIKQLAGMPRFRVTVISGRSLKSLQELIPVAGIFLAGVYGCELQTPAGNRMERGDYSQIRPLLERVKPRWESLIADQPGFILEDKGWTLALHAPDPLPAEAGKLMALARQAARRDLPENIFRWFDSPAYLELAPVEANKGETVNLLYRGFPYPEARLLYFGDDDKDQEAFEVVHAFDGLNIQVSDPENPFLSPWADYLMDSPHAVRKWLQNLL